jgi:hypothetical protein
MYHFKCLWQVTLWLLHMIHDVGSDSLQCCHYYRPVNKTHFIICYVQNLYRGNINRSHVWLSDILLTMHRSIYQYSKTNMMHFLFSLLRVKGLYMFRALLAQLQELLHKWHWVSVCMLCQLAAPGLEWKSNPGAANWRNTHTHNIPNAICVAPPEDEQLMFETCRVP